MSRLRLALLATAVSSMIASTSWGQRYQYEFEAKTFSETPSGVLPEKIDLAPIGSFERTEIEFAGQEAAYGDNHWGKVEFYTLDRALTGRLVFYYDPQGIAAMKQRVADAEVVDENALFPITIAEFISQLGHRCRACDYPAFGSPQGLIVKTIDQPSGRSRYGEKPSLSKVEQGFIVVNYADSQLLGMSP